MGRIGELALGGEGVGVQPVQQLLAVGGDHAGLRVVDVGVDEAGDDQRVAVFDDLHAAYARQQVAGMADVDDLAVFHDQQAVFEVFVGVLGADLGGVGDAVQDGGAIGFDVGCHGHSRCKQIGSAPYS
ncbi:hypothetical protein D3C76_1210910 [compost metagenome]